MAELKPCPFCGEEEIYAEISYENKELRIYCAFCPAEMNLSFSDVGLDNGQVIGFDEMQAVIEEMIGKWNTRTQKEGEQVDR